VDKNASLEEEYRKVAAFKPLMESYKNQIADLESKAASRNKAYETALFELEQTRTRLRITEEERAKDSEALELYQERVRELELSSHRPIASDQSKRQSSHGTESSPSGRGDEDEDFSNRLGGELDDALAGTTLTDLKLQVRKLKRELEDSRTNQLDSSRVLVLENLLDDANRMKARYEADYLASHREKLVLQNKLEDIRSGNALGDGYVGSWRNRTLLIRFLPRSPEAAIALRQRLNETVSELDNLKRDHTELEVRNNALSRELTIAKSDCLSYPRLFASSLTLFHPVALVNRDQLDILASLRESVNDDKLALEEEVARLQQQSKEAAEKNKMQLEQINSLLLEKVNLQSEGIGQREKMLQRERDFGCVSTCRMKHLAD
jgi:protein HOOK3